MHCILKPNVSDSIQIPPVSQCQTQWLCPNSHRIVPLFPSLYIKIIEVHEGVHNSTLICRNFHSEKRRLVQSLGQSHKIPMPALLLLIIFIIVQF